MSDNPIISIRNITKRFGTFTALEDISIDIEPGEFFALLGPSGCGKSTLLRIIAGIEMPTEGDLLIDGQDMTDTPPNKRPVNMVFQSYAVFPHMSVTKNVAYGLQLQGLPKSEIAAMVDQALEQVYLSDFKHRMPDQLSGGQRQRVALARALVKRPRVLLLDEPLSALDAKLRDAMRLELVKLQESVGVSFIMVTHDQSEALAMADRVAVLDEGRLRQLASPAELYQNPCDAFVADFIGNINMFDITGAEAGDDNVVFATDELGRMAFPADTLTKCGGNAGGHLLAIRPEKIKVDLREPHTDAPSARGRLGDVAFQGKSSIIEVILEGGRSITAYVHDSDAAVLLAAETGSDIWCSWDTADVLVLPKSA